MSQTTYTSNMAIGVQGQRADMGAKGVASFVAEGSLTFGLLCSAGTDPDKQVIPVAALPVTDVDSIIETAVTADTSEVIASGTDFDSAVFGAGPIIPCQRVTIALNSHADWDATTGQIWGEDASGHPIWEEFDIPDAGNVTRTTTHLFRKVDKIVIPAQTSTNATFTAGTVIDDYELSRLDMPGFVMYDPGTEPESSTVDVGDEDPVNVLTKGTMYVTVEAAVVKGDAVWVRMLESLPDLRGQVRGSYAANFARLPGAKFLTSQATADGLAVIQLD